MKRKMLALLIVLALVMSLVAACGEPAATPQEPTGDTTPTEAPATTDTETPAGGEDVAPAGVPEELVIVDSEWEGVDMYQCDSWNDMQCLYADSILNKADDGSAIPCIASNSVWSEDGLTWTLTFPEGMYYSTGEQLEPEDVVASIEHGLECSSYADGYQFIESMEVSGRDVIIHLSQFQADMEFNFMQCFVGVIDKDELDSMSNEELLWGCHPYGPYYVDEYSPGAYAVLKANPGYTTSNPLVQNKGAVPVQTIRIVMGGEDFNYFTGIGTGEYDILSSAPADYLEDLANNSEITLVESAGATVAYAEYNIKNEFLSDINVRKALIKAFNRDNIDAYTSVYYSSTHCLIQDNCLNYDEAAVEYYKANYGYDLEGAKALLAEAGWADTDGDGYVDKDGKKFSITFSSRDSDTPIIAAESFRDDLKAIGVELNITTQDWSYVNQDVRDGNFDIAFLSLGWSEPMLLIDNFCNRSDIAAECTNLDREGYLALVAQARQTVDYNERTEVITEIQKKLFDYCTIMPLYQPTDYRCWRAELKGIVTTATGGFYLSDVSY